MTMIKDTLAIATAIGALKLKRHQLRGVGDGVEIHQPGKPVLLLTHEAARRFANDVAEAEA